MIKLSEFLTEHEKSIYSCTYSYKLEQIKKEIFWREPANKEPLLTCIIPPEIYLNFKTIYVVEKLKCNRFNYLYSTYIEPFLEL